MRTEAEMMKLILETAEKDERIRAVCMNGSRVNPNVPKDLFQDYDIVYLVTEMESFFRDASWIDCFGERLILQMPEAMKLFPPELGGRFTYLMQFTDGNRIDLCLTPLSMLQEYCREDKLIRVLMDKDGILPKLPPPTDKDYHVKKPDETLFRDCCNEFWWVSNYVAKGLWRKEFLYAVWHINQCVRPMLLQMLEWKVGFETNFSISVGKMDKYLLRYLPEKTAEELVQTHRLDGYDETWKALFLLQDLFQKIAREVAGKIGCPFDQDQHSKITEYLNRIYQLKEEAEEI